MLFAQTRVFDLLEMQRISVHEAERLLRAMAGSGTPAHSRWTLRLSAILFFTATLLALDIGLRCGWNFGSTTQLLQQGCGRLAHMHWSIRSDNFYPFHVYLLNLSGGLL